MLLTRNDLHIVKLLVQSFFCKFMDKAKKKFMDKAAGKVLAKREQDQYSPV